MEATERLRAQIDRSTQRLAQLQARELIFAQRNAVRIRQASRRAETRRKIELGAFVIAAGAGDLDGREIVGALLSYRDKVGDPQQRELFKRQGSVHLAARDSAHDGNSTHPRHQ
jgi:hypothetical protein